MATRSTAQRAADRRYNAATAHLYKKLACKVKAEEAEEFEAKCRERGTTVNAVLTAAVRDFMKE